jgi:phosphoglycolate phosphatase
MTFKGILFDKDGTLIEADAIWVPFYRRQLMRLKQIDQAAADALMSLAGYDPMMDRMRAGSIMAGGTTAQLVDIWWLDRNATERAAIIQDLDLAAKHDVDMEPQPVGDIRGLVMAFKAHGWHVGVATNDSLVSTERQVNQLNIHDLIDAVITSDTVESPKPSGDMIRRFASLTGLAVSDIVMVGDNFHDIEEARKGGAGLAVGVLSGNGQREDLLPIADLVVETVTHLRDHFGLR